MKTAIFRKFIQLLLLALLLNTAILYIVTGSVILNNSRNDMVFILDTIDSAFHYEGDSGSPGGADFPVCEFK